MRPIRILQREFEDQLKLRHSSLKGSYKDDCDDSLSTPSTTLPPQDERSVQGEKSTVPSPTPGVSLSSMRSIDTWQADDYDEEYMDLGSAGCWRSPPPADSTEYDDGHPDGGAQRRRRGRRRRSQWQQGVWHDDAKTRQSWDWSHSAASSDEGEAEGHWGAPEASQRRPPLRGARQQDQAQKENQGAPHGDSTVVFSHVPMRASEDHLRELFGKVGNILTFELDRGSDGRSLGSGQCRFYSAAVAQKAVWELSGQYVHGRSMYVCLLSRHRPRGTDHNAGGAGKQTEYDAEERPTSVVFSSVSEATTEGFLRGQFEKFGPLLSFELSRRQDGRSLGKGSCEYARRADALEAIEDMDRSYIDHSVIRVTMDTRPPRNPWARVFFHNVGWQTREDEVRYLFEDIGPMRSFELRVKWDGRSLGMGSCEYQREADAETAIAELNGVEFQGRKIYVSEFIRPTPGR